MATCHACHLTRHLGSCLGLTSGASWEVGYTSLRAHLGWGGTGGGSDGGEARDLLRAQLEVEDVEVLLLRVRAGVGVRVGFGFGSEAVARARVRVSGQVGSVAR